MPLGNPIRKQNESRIISVLATEGQSVFTIEGGYIINQISVFRNGVRLSNAEDFTAGDGSTVTLNDEANVDDRIEFHIFDKFTVQNAIVGAASSQTINGDLVLTGKLFGNLDVPSINTGITTTALLDVGNLTNGRVVYVGSNSGRLVDSGNLTFDGTTLSISGLNATGVTTVGKQIHVGTGVSIAAGGLNVTAGISTFQAVQGTTGTFTSTVKSGTTATGTIFSVGDSGTSGDRVIQFKRAATTNDINIQAINSGSGATNLLFNQEGGAASFGGAVSATTGTFTGDVSIADKIVHTGDTNTAIRFPGNDQISFETSGTERARVDSVGNVLLGLTSTLSSNNARLQVAHTDGNADIIVHRAGDNANPPGLNFQKTRNASIGDYGTIVQDDDELGSIRWGGADGSAIAFAARIVGAVDGTPGANDMPGRIQFHTSADGSEGMTERLRIDSTGALGLGVGGITSYFKNNSGNYRQLQIGLGAHFYGRTDDTQIYLVSNGYRDGSNWKYTANTTASQIAMGTHIVFETAGAGTAGDNISFNERLRIDSNGMIGIGGVVPKTQNTFDAIEFGKTGFLGSQTGARTVEMASNAYYNSGWKYKENDVASQYYQYQGYHAFTSAVSGSADGAISFVERLRITSGGKVNIGGDYTNTTSTLRVIGDSNAGSQTFLEKNSGSTNNTYNTSLTISSRSTGSAAANYGPAIGFQHSFGSSNYAGSLIASQCNSDANTADLVFYPRNYGYTEALRIASGGNVGINTAAPSRKFEISGGTNSIYNFTINGGNASTGMKMGNYTASAGYNKLSIEASDIIFYTGTQGTTSSTEKLRIASGGGILIGSGNQTKTQDGVLIERNSGDGLAHITAGRSGSNYSGFEFYVAGASGVTKRHRIDYEGGFKWYGADGTTEKLRIASTGFMGPIPRTGAWQGTFVYRQRNQSSNYEHKIRGPLSGYLDSELTNNFVAYIKVQTLGTGTANAFCYYRYAQNSSGNAASLNHIHGNSSGNSNAPYMVLDGQAPCWKMAHSTNYDVVVRVEVTGGDDGETFTSSGDYAAN